MKRQTRRILSLILALSLCLNAAAGIAAAEGLPEENSPETMIETEEINVGGSGDVGGLIAAAISEEQTQRAVDSECRITALEFSGSTATVEYTVSEETNAEIVVAVYEKEIGQMTASGKVRVLSDSGAVQVQMDGEMPEYFIASAFLLDAKDHEPLCDAFTTQLYTEDMVNIQNATVDDFEEENVLNLDSSRETNFAVYGEETKVVREVSQMNQITDNGDGSYTVFNADAEFKALAEGDTFSYVEADGTTLLVKAGSVSVNGDTVTVWKDEEADLTDFFDYVKIEADSADPGSELTVDNSQLEDGITCEGADSGDEGVGTIALEGDLTNKNSVSYMIEYKKGTSASVKVSGKLKFEIGVNIKFYIAKEHQFLSMKSDYSVGVSVSFSGEAEKSFALGKLKVMTSVPGVFVELTPSIVLKASGGATWNGSVKGAFGFAFDSISGFQDLGSSPSGSDKIDFEGTFFVGLDGKPSIVILDEALCGTKLSVSEGLEFKAEKYQEPEGQGDSIHECELCFEGEVNVVMNVSVKINFTKLLKKQISLVNFRGKVGEFYISRDYEEVEAGRCPHVRHRVSVDVEDENGAALAGIELQVLNVETGEAVDRLTQNSETPVVTGADGSRDIYLANGSYKITALGQDSKADRAVLVTVSGEKQQVKIVLKDKPDPDDPEETETPEIPGEEWKELAGGATGSLSWRVVEAPDAYAPEYTYSVLYITGKGAMPDYESDGAPWSQKNLSEDVHYDKVIIGDGITSIGAYAFEDISVEIYIPDSVVKIGKYAFAYCSLDNIRLPDSVILIDGYAFYHFEGRSIRLSTNLAEIRDHAFELAFGISSLNISDSVTAIGDYAFCSSGLSGITIPESVTKMGEGIFSGCSSLSRVELPVGLKEIKYGTFYGCKDLISVEIPDSVTKIEPSAFDGCSSLSSVDIPDSVTELGSPCHVTVYDEDSSSFHSGSVFEGCTNLSDVKLSENLTVLYKDTFADCSSLVSIDLPDSIKKIEYDTFENCICLAHIGLGRVEELEFGVFDGCVSLESIEFPSSINWLESVGYTGLKSIYFQGDRPFFAYNVFEGITATAYYPQDNDTWQGISEEEERLGGTITWLPYDPLAPGTEGLETSGDNPQAVAVGNDVPDEFETEIPETISLEVDLSGTERSETILPESEMSEMETETVLTEMVSSEETAPETETLVFDLSAGWETDIVPWTEEMPETSEEDDALIVETSSMEVFADSEGDPVTFVSSFTNLMPGAPYVFAAVCDQNASDLFASDNLLYIAQSNADENGNVTFSYRPRDGIQGETAVYGVPGETQDVPKQTETGQTGPGQLKPRETEAKQTGLGIVTLAQDSVTNGKKGIILSWKHVSGAEGYRVYRKKNNGKWTVLTSKTVSRTTAGGSAVSYTDKKVKNGVKYAYAVQAFAGDVVGSFNEKGVSIVRLSAPKLKKAVSKASKRLTVSWGNNKKASGYQIQYSEKRTFKNAKVKNIAGAKKLSAVLSKLKSKKKYYVRIRTYKKSGGKKYYSSWSGVKSAKIK